MTPLSCAHPAKNVFVFFQGTDAVDDSFGANSTAIVGSEAVLLIDPGIAPATARNIEQFLRTWTSLPIAAVVLTHHHTDHAMGALEFSRRGIPVLAHPAAVAGIAREHPKLLAERRLKPELVPLFADAEPYAPSRAVTAEIEIDLGGFSARVFPIGPAHTPGDLAVHVPSEGVVVTGDVISNGYHVNYEDADLAGWRAALERIKTLEYEILVPGHGAASTPGEPETQLRYHDTVEGIIRGFGRSGRSKTETIDEIRLRFPGFRLEILLPDTVDWFAAAG